MKVQPTPTSPKARLASSSSEELTKLYRDEAFAPIPQPGHTRRRSVGLFFVVVLIGLVAGAAGALLVDATVLPFDVRTGVDRIIQSQDKKSTQQAAQLLHDRVEPNQKSLLLLYDGATVNGAHSLYRPQDQRGTAILLTEDGWALTSGELLRASAGMVAVTSDRKVLALKNITYDTATDLAFFKIDGTRYAPAQFASNFVFTTFTSVTALAATSSELEAQAQSVNISGPRIWNGNVVTDSEVLPFVTGLSTSLSEAYAGGSIVDDHGMIVGFIRAGSKGDSTAWSFTVLTNLLTSFLKDRKIHHSYLGVRSVDLATVAGVPESERFGKNSGALLVADGTRPAVEPKSPAAKAGIVAGDVVTKIGNQSIDGTASLAERLYSIAPHSTVDITFVRGGKEQSVKMTLGDTVDLH